MTVPDIAQVVVAKLRTKFAADFAVPSDQVGTVTPVDVQDRLPFVRVRAGGGPRTKIEANTTVDVLVLAADYDGKDLAERIDDYLIAPFAWQVDHMECQSGPQEVPWVVATGQSSVRAWTATYIATTRRA